MAENTTITDDDATFLRDLIGTNSFHVRESLLETYSGRNIPLVLVLQRAMSSPRALDRVNMIAHKYLAEYHLAKSKTLADWIQQKDSGAKQWWDAREAYENEG